MQYFSDTGAGQARVGHVINKKYRLVRLIGTGGVACVYEAVHRNGDRVAIKVLHDALSRDREIRSRFLREGYVANKVRHPGVVRVLDDDTAEDGSAFLVMDLLDGESVDARWARAGRRLPVAEVCGLALQLLDVLAAAHREGIVHRDIKPDNLFVEPDGRLRVLDFGIARLRDTGRPVETTRTGRMIGTPAFMPPEQALGRTREIDARTDLYAVGATMFTLLSGRFVHEAETEEEMLVRAGSRPARPLLGVSPAVSPAVAAVVDTALSFEASGRYRSAAEMTAALEGARRDLAPATADAGALSQGTEAADASRPGARVEDSRPEAAPTRVSTRVGFSTGSSEPAPGTVSDRPARSFRRWGLAAAAVGLLGAGAWVFARSAPHRAPASGVEVTVVEAPHVAPEVASSSSAPALPMPSASSSAQPPPDAPRAVPSAPRASLQPVNARPSAPAPPAPPSPRAAPSESCDPPYFVDGSGHRQYKLDCLRGKKP